GMFWDLHWREVMASRLYRDTNLLELAIKLGFRLPYVLLLIEAVATARAWRREADARALAARAAHLPFAAAVMAALSKPRDWIHLSVVVVPLAPIVARQLAALDVALPRIPRDGRLHVEPHPVDPAPPGPRAGALRGPRHPLSHGTDLRSRLRSPDRDARRAAPGVARAGCAPTDRPARHRDRRAHP